MPVTRSQARAENQGTFPYSANVVHEDDSAIERTARRSARRTSERRPRQPLVGRDSNVEENTGVESGIKHNGSNELDGNGYKLSEGEQRRVGRRRARHAGPSVCSEVVGNKRARKTRISRKVKQRRAQGSCEKILEPEQSERADGSLLEGMLGLLPREVLEQILGYLDPKDLAMLEITCRYFIDTGITEQIARHHLKGVARAKGLMPMLNKGETHVTLLEFVQGQSAAAAQSTAVGMGSYHTVGLLSTEGSDSQKYGMYAFGRGFHGQMGNGQFNSYQSPVLIETVQKHEPVRLYDESRDNVRLAVVHAGSCHNAAISRRGELFTWGLGSSGELGQGGWSPTEVNVPRALQYLNRTRIVSVCAGSNHTLAISENGQLWSCGRGRFGQLGHDHFHDEARLRLIETIREERIVSAAAGKYHSMALTACGKLFTWGAGKHGQLGWFPMDDPEPDSPVPVEVSYLNPRHLSPTHRITAISAGGYHSMVLTVCGNLLGCGRNKEGQLGLQSGGADVKNFSMVDLNELEPRHQHSRATQVQCGMLHTLVLVQTQGKKAVYACGDNSYGQLGNGSQMRAKCLVKINGIGSGRIASITSGDWHCGAITCDGELHTWGRGDCGQLGHGDDKSLWVPKKVDHYTVVHPDRTLRRSRKVAKEAIILSSPLPTVKARHVSVAGNSSQHRV